MYCEVTVTHSCGHPAKIGGFITPDKREQWERETREEFSKKKCIPCWGREKNETTASQ